MSSYIIEAPENNFPKNLYSFSTESAFLAFPQFKNLLNAHSITPESYPRVIDLGSGDGGVAAFLVRLGWISENITCVDMYKAPRPAVTDVVWLYINLKLLAVTLSDQENNSIGLDQRVSVLQGVFDLMTCNFVYIDTEHIARLVKFFLKPNGIAIVNNIAKRRESF